MNLWEHSIAVIKTNQFANGAFVACPSFPTYRYSWFRDGAYIAHALDLAGERDSARRFFEWAIWTIELRRDATLRAIEAGLAGEIPREQDLLETRYTVDGEPGEMHWFNNQMDGFGTLLWAIEQHHSASQLPIATPWTPTVRLLADYLAALWSQP